MTRHCTRCGTEVEDAGGYCLLGHPLRHSMETASLVDLKNEVEAAFEGAAAEVREAMDPLIGQVKTAVPAVSEELDPAYAAAVAAAPARYASPAEISSPATPAGLHQPKHPVPPPPPPKRAKSKFEALWDGMDDQSPLDRSDPINAFAPPPRMDWGPERSGKARGLRRLGFSNA